MQISILSLLEAVQWIHFNEIKVTEYLSILFEDEKHAWQFYFYGVCYNNIFTLEK